MRIGLLDDRAGSFFSVIWRKRKASLANKLLAVCGAFRMWERSAATALRASPSAILLGTTAAMGVKEFRGNFALKHFKEHNKARGVRLQRL